jgi:hypothetical protein
MPEQVRSGKLLDLPFLLLSRLPGESGWSERFGFLVDRGIQVRYESVLA